MLRIIDQKTYLPKNLFKPLQTHHLYFTLKRRGDGHFHVVSTWNTRGVFVNQRVSVIQCDDWRA